SFNFIRDKGGPRTGTRYRFIELNRPWGTPPDVKMQIPLGAVAATTVVMKPATTAVAVALAGAVGAQQPAYDYSGIGLCDGMAYADGSSCGVLDMRRS